MSKGNLFLGFARGKVGDVVFSRNSGEQVARARNRSPKNPQSALQMLQRVCMKTSSSAFSMMQAICNHSYQGRQEGTPCQSRFTELNVAQMRRQLRDLIEQGDPTDIMESIESNFAGKYDTGAQIRPYVISEGTLPVMSYEVGSLGECVAALDIPGLATTVAATMTYQQVINALGLQAGDQITFVALSVDDTKDGSTFNAFKFARVILMPSDGDLSKPFFKTGTGQSDYDINLPNEANEGTVGFTINQGKAAFFLSGLDPNEGTAYATVACAVIASRLSGGVWQRSTQSLAIQNLASLSHVHDEAYLSGAIASFLTVQNSSLYLNQAEGF